VVKKFRRSKQRYFLREISALRDLKEHDVFNVIPPLVFCNVDDLEYAIPYFNDSLQGMMQKASLGDTIPLSVVRKAFASAKKFYEAGYEFCDFGPHNILLDEVQGMKFIDFEFVFKTDRQKTIPFVESQWVKGPDPSVSDDVPYIQGMEKGQAYVYVCPWHLGCGVPVSVILNGTALGEGSSKLKIRTLFNVVKYKIRSFPKNVRRILSRVYRNFIKSV
jgi:hypothetical protein